ncbi:MAG: hypothetical protein OEL82_02675, partial [Nitrosopumilus sp.]|nr:hypothetical protein [Nitrosopumilus sp.]
NHNLNKQLHLPCVPTTKAMHKASTDDSSVRSIYYISRLSLLTVMFIPVRPSRRESDEDELNE